MKIEKPVEIKFHSQKRKYYFCIKIKMELDRWKTNYFMKIESLKI